MHETRSFRMAGQRAYRPTHASRKGNSTVKMRLRRMASVVGYGWGTRWRSILGVYP